MDGYRHTTLIEVRFKDLDVFGHVNNGVIFTYVEMARIRYLVDLGLRSAHANWQGIAFILAHINCDFRRPIFFEERVEVGTRVSEIKRSSFRLEHRIEANGELAAEGYGILVHFDYAANHSIPVPPDMRVKIAEYEKGMNLG